MVGGNGDDDYYVDSKGDKVLEASGGGIDLVYSEISYTLGAHVEYLALDGTSSINGTGNTLANFILGNDGNNLLSGLAENDTLNGGAGNDTLNGGTGDDVMSGGDGDDTFIVDVAGDVVTGGDGTDTVQSSITYTLAPLADVENLTLTGTAVINGTGNGLDNHIIGNAKNNTLTDDAGNDTLDGGAGNDTLIGGSGDDTYGVNSLLDVITEDPGAGTDTILSSITYTLNSAVNVENLTLSGTSSNNGTGDELDNVITGNAGRNTLNGMDGDDTISGGLGSDRLTGGNGADQFVFDSALSSSNMDTITDFVVGTDTIVLDNDVFTALGVGALSIDAYRIGTKAIDADDRIIYDYAGTGALYYDADGSGSGAAVKIADLESGLTLTRTDFLIVD